MPKHAVRVHVTAPFTETDRRAFRRLVMRILQDARGWPEEFVRHRGPDVDPRILHITLCTPDYMEREACPGLGNAREMSCYHGGDRDQVYINAARWYQGSDAFFRGRRPDGAPLDMDDYRAYVVSHEVGHWRGLGHDLACDARGRSPVMMQQTLGHHDRATGAACAADPWPQSTAGD